MDIRTQMLRTRPARPERVRHTEPVDIDAMRHLLEDTTGAFRHHDARPMLGHALDDLEQERARNAALTERLHALQGLMLVENPAAA